MSATRHGGTALNLDFHHASRYYAWVIRSFKCRETAALHARSRVRRFASIETIARRKLRQLEIAARLDDLRLPPGNRLEGLKGERAGQYSIRINDQLACLLSLAARSRG